MNTERFDGIVREMGEVSTRRGVLRLLGGASAMSAGLVLGTGLDSLARGTGKRRGHSQAHGRERERVAAQGKKGKKVTICYQGQTRTVKKSKLGNFPGATRGACPIVGNNGNTGGNTGGNGGNNGGTPPPPPCTKWIISGGPDPSTPITADDDLSIVNVTNGTVILNDNNGMAGPISARFFDANVGDVLRVRLTDWGGCRSLSPLWLHCYTTGQSKQLYTGYNGVGCNNPKQVDFLDFTLTVSL